MIEEGGNRCVRDLGERIRLERIPDVKQEQAAPAKDAIRFPHRTRFVRHEHQPKLANDCAKQTIRKWESGRIGLLPAHVFGAFKFRLCEFKHVRVQIGRDDFGRHRQRVAQSSGDDSSAAGDFQQRLNVSVAQAPGNVPGERFENYRTEITIVIFRDRSLEKNVAIRFHYKLGMRSAEESLSTRRRMEFHQSS